MPIVDARLLVGEAAEKFLDYEKYPIRGLKERPLGPADVLDFGRCPARWLWRPRGLDRQPL